MRWSGALLQAALADQAAVDNLGSVAAGIREWPATCAGQRSSPPPARSDSADTTPVLPRTTRSAPS